MEPGPPTVDSVRLAFLNPQGNFDAADSHWTEHPDFGGQLVYVKNVALALAALGHEVDIVTRLVDDPEWPEFCRPVDTYPGVERVRIVRIPCGPPGFLPKEELWFHLGSWVGGISEFYRDGLPDAAAGHYADGGVAAALLRAHHGVPFTFTAHSLGAQKMDKLGANAATLAELDRRYLFRRRVVAERTAMSHAGLVITSTNQERFDQYGHPAYSGAIEPNDDQRFRIVPPGVALDVFSVDRPNPSETATKQHVEAALAGQIPADRTSLPAVVASSRLDPKKNIVALVEAFAASPELRERANLVLFTGALAAPLADPSGAGPIERAELDRIRTVIDRAHLHETVAAFGIQGQPALAAAYRHLAGRQSVFALTTLYEPFGLAPLEAAAAGLPVVVTRNGGPSESLREGTREYGVLVDPENPDDVAAGLLRALGPEGRALAAAGRQRVLDRYTWDRTAIGYLEAIDAASAFTPATPVHPFFTEGEPDISLAELQRLYLGAHDDA